MWDTTPMTSSLLFLLMFFGSNVQCKRIRQCTCNEMEKCREKMLSLVKPCANKCQQYAYNVKADYQRLKNCVLQNEDKLTRTIDCVQNIFYNACAKKPGYFVQQRYTESLEIAGLAELNRMLGELARPLQPLIAVGRRFLRCSRECIEKSSKHCYDRLQCGLDLPDDSETIHMVKQCATTSGFDNTVIQEMCSCASSAGIRHLRDVVCPRLQIS